MSTCWYFTTDVFPKSHMESYQAPFINLHLNFCGNQHILNVASHFPVVVLFEHSLPDILPAAVVCVFQSCVTLLPQTGFWWISVPFVCVLPLRIPSVTPNFHVKISTFFKGHEWIYTCYIEFPEPFYFLFYFHLWMLPYFYFYVQFMLISWFIHIWVTLCN